MAGQAAPAPRVAPWSRRDRLVGLGIVAGWLVLLGGVLGWGAAPADLDSLTADVRGGRVHEVRVSEGLEPGARGFALVTVEWRTGLLAHRTEIRQRPEGTFAPGREPEGVVTGDVGEWLRAQQPGLGVRPLEEVGGTEIGGWSAPDWAAILALPLVVLTFVFLVGGPQPWRATRWAWFWLALSGAPGLAFYLVLGGPLGVWPPRQDRRRMGGGVGLLLALVLAAASRSIQ